MSQPQGPRRCWCLGSSEGGDRSSGRWNELKESQLMKGRLLHAGQQPTGYMVTARAWKWAAGDAGRRQA
jgi:hypothetical protein